DMTDDTPSLVQRAWTVTGRGIHAARTFYSAGMITADRPDRLIGLVQALRKWGNTPAAGYAAAAARYPDEDAIIDELGRLTFAELLEDAGKRRKRFVAWHDSEKPADPTIDDLIEEGDPTEPVPPSEEHEYRAVILTSGTTGTPKGASRSQPTSILPAAAMLDR